MGHFDFIWPKVVNVHALLIPATQKTLLFVKSYALDPFFRLLKFEVAIKLIICSQLLIPVYLNGDRFTHWV